MCNVSLAKSKKTPKPDKNETVFRGTQHTCKDFGVWFWRLSSHAADVGVVPLDLRRFFVGPSVDDGLDRGGGLKAVTKGRRWGAVVERLNDGRIGLATGGRRLLK